MSDEENQPGRSSLFQRRCLSVAATAIAVNLFLLPFGFSFCPLVAAYQQALEGLWPGKKKGGGGHTSNALSHDFQDVFEDMARRQVSNRLMYCICMRDRIIVA